MEQVEEICDKIVLVNKGKKILDGSLAKIKNDFKEHIFKVGFDTIPETFDSEIFKIVDTKDNTLIVKIDDQCTPAMVLQEFLHHRASIISFNEILPSLNEIFINQVEDTKKAREFAEVVN
jgi:ABC-2 type transport system ATP-binding protein